VKAALAVACTLLLLAACSSTPPPPDWQASASGAVDRAVAAYLQGRSSVADAEFRLARSELTRTGDAAQVALAELTRCALRVASADFGPCEGFEPLRADATPAQRAYADYLANRLAPGDAALLPLPQRAVATSGAAALAGIEDPLSRLVATGVLFRAGRADRTAIAQAVDTASAQGWRRPLLAWLNVELALAEKAGDSAAAEQLRRRIALTGGTR